VQCVSLVVEKLLFLTGGGLDEEVLGHLSLPRQNQYPAVDPQSMVLVYLILFLDLSQRYLSHLL
jgi:hypothetical protein